MELKKMNLEKHLHEEGISNDKKWMRDEVILKDLHSQVETRLIARVQKRVIESGIELTEGKEYDVQLDFKTHDWNGKTFNDLSIWQMEESRF